MLHVLQYVLCVVWVLLLIILTVLGKLIVF